MFVTNHAFEGHLSVVIVFIFSDAFVVGPRGFGLLGQVASIVIFPLGDDACFVGLLCFECVVRVVFPGDLAAVCMGFFDDAVPAVVVDAALVAVAVGGERAVALSLPGAPEFAAFEFALQFAIQVIPAFYVQSFAVEGDEGVGVGVGVGSGSRRVQFATAWCGRCRR